MSMTSVLKVLDKGYVRLENFCGGDESVLRSARVSYGKNPESDDERDKKLLQYLLANDHGTPFEHNLFTFHVKAPIFVFRQWHRSRIGVSYNELSARYTEMREEFYVPEKWRAQDTKNKQGGLFAGVSFDHALCSEILEKTNAESMVQYRRLLALGVAREMARMVLPVNLYSEMYFTCNARSLMAFIRLRSDSHAQWETRQYSHAMAFLFREAMPWTFDAMLLEMNKDELSVPRKRDYNELAIQLGYPREASKVREVR